MKDYSYLYAMVKKAGTDGKSKDKAVGGEENKAEYTLPVSPELMFTTPDIDIPKPSQLGLTQNVDTKSRVNMDENGKISGASMQLAQEPVQASRDLLGNYISSSRPTMVNGKPYVTEGDVQSATDRARNTTRDRLSAGIDNWLKILKDKRDSIFTKENLKRYSPEIGAGLVGGISMYAALGAIPKMKKKRILRLLAGLGTSALAAYGANVGMNAYAKSKVKSPAEIA